MPQLEFVVVILVGTISSFVLSLVRQQSVFTASVVFSASWVLVLLSHSFIIAVAGFDAVPQVSYKLLNSTITIMFIGLLFGQLLSSRNLGRPAIRLDKYTLLPLYVADVIPGVVFIAAAFGLASFISTGASFDVSFSFLSSVRDAHVAGESGGVSYKLATYSSLLVSAFAAILGVSHAVEGRFRPLQLSALMLALVPLSFSSGSRLPVVQPLVFYIFAVWIMLGYRLNGRGAISMRSRFIRRYLARILPLIVIVLIAFTLYGNVRSEQKTALSDGSSVAKLFYPVAGYVQSSLISVGPISHWIDSSSNVGFGERYFEVFFKLPAKVGLYQLVRSKEQVRSQWNLFQGSVYTPGTAIRHLVSDFGLSGLPIAAFIIMFLSGWVVHSIRPRSLVTIVAVVLVLKDVGFSFHKVALFSMSNVWVLLAAYMFSLHFQRFVRGHLSSSLPQWEDPAGGTRPRYSLE